MSRGACALQSDVTEGDELLPEVVEGECLLEVFSVEDTFGLLKDGGVVNQVVE